MNVRRWALSCGLAVFMTLLSGFYAREEAVPYRLGTPASELCMQDPKDPNTCLEPGIAAPSKHVAGWPVWFISWQDEPGSPTTYRLEAFTLSFLLWFPSAIAMVLLAPKVKRKK